MKTMCPPSYHHNGFVAIIGKAHCFHDVYGYMYLKPFSDVFHKKIILKAFMY